MHAITILVYCTINAQFMIQISKFRHQKTKCMETVESGRNLTCVSVACLDSLLGKYGSSNLHGPPKFNGGT